MSGRQRRWGGPCPRTGATGPARRAPRPSLTHSFIHLARTCLRLPQTRSPGWRTHARNDCFSCPTPPGSSPTTLHRGTKRTPDLVPALRPGPSSILHPPHRPRGPGHVAALLTTLQPLPTATGLKPGCAPSSQPTRAKPPSIPASLTQLGTGPARCRLRVFALRLVPVTWPPWRPSPTIPAESCPPHPRFSPRGLV